MKILIDMGHPADVHYFKHVIETCKSRGDQITVLARDKDVTHHLLRACRIPFIDKGRGGTALFDRVFYTAKSLHRLRKIFRSMHPDLCISHSSPYLAVMAGMYGVPHIMFNDTERGKWLKLVGLWGNSQIYLPDAFMQRGIPGAHYIPSYMELAYLHPDHFTPDDGILESTGEHYVLLRFVANTATHDIGKPKLDDDFKRELVHTISGYTKVWISSEADVPGDLAPYLLQAPSENIHDVIAHATFLAGDSATMSAEAAVLGVPSFYLSDNRLGYIKELDETYRLVSQYPNNKQGKAAFVKQLVSVLETGQQPDLRSIRRSKMLRDKVNLAAMMTDIVEKARERIEINRSHDLSV